MQRPGEAGSAHGLGCRAAIWELTEWFVQRPTKAGSAHRLDGSSSIPPLALNAR
jgi:hypothetical protein